MHVEWYYGDFSDGEAVSPSSTTILRLLKNAPRLALFCVHKIKKVSRKCCGKVVKKL